MKDIEEYLKAYGLHIEWWREVAQKVYRWFQRVEEGVEASMWERHKAEGGGDGRATREGCNHDVDR